MHRSDKGQYANSPSRCRLDGPLIRSPSKRPCASRATPIIDAEVVCARPDGMSDFEALHSRTSYRAIACAVDLMMLDDDDLRRRPLVEHKTVLHASVPIFGCRTWAEKLHTANVMEKCTTPAWCVTLI